MRMFSSAPFVLVLSLIISCLPLAPGRAAQRQSSIKVQSDLVQIDATVADKNGGRISGLQLHNFQLFEDNQPQRLAVVDYFDVPKVPQANGSREIHIDLMRSNDSRTLNEIGNGHRLLVLFFDKTSMEPEDLLDAINAAKQFVKDQMTPADLVTITTFGTRLDVKSDFTNDRSELEETLDSMTPGNRSKKTAPAGGLDDSINPKSGVANTELRLDAAGALANMLAQISGRKSVMHFTGGLLQSRFGNAHALDAATDAANKSNVSFYEVDARALTTVIPKDEKLHTFFQQMNDLDDSRSTLGTLAEDTGGALFTDTNDFSAIFKQVQDLSTGYYLLSYVSSNKQHDGGYRRVSVKLVDVPEGRVTFRQGYYAAGR